MSLEQTNETGHLEVLGDSDYEIADGQPDIRGWDVKDSQGRPIGIVDELLFSPEARKVRYLLLDLNEKTEDDYRQVLIPIGVAELHAENDDVIIPGIAVEQLADLPLYAQGHLTPGEEYRIRSVFEGLHADAYSQSTYDRGDFYTHRHFDDARLYATRSTSGASDRAPEEVLDTEVTGDAFGNSEEGIATGTAPDHRASGRLATDTFVVREEQAEDEPNYTGQPDTTAGAAPREPKDGSDSPGKTF